MGNLTAQQQKNLVQALSQEMHQCWLQVDQGWYKKSCRQLGTPYRKQCVRCRVLTRVERAIA